MEEEGRRRLEQAEKEMRMEKEERERGRWEASSDLSKGLEDISGEHDQLRRSPSAGPRHHLLPER